MSNIAYRIAQNRVHEIEVVVNDLILDHREADFSRDVEDILREMIRVGDSLKDAATRCGPGIRPGTTRQQIVRAHLFGSLLGRMVGLIARVQELIGDVHKCGHTIEDETDFEIVRRELPTLKQKFDKSWMLPNEESVRLSKNELADGNFIVL